MNEFIAKRGFPTKTACSSCKRATFCKKISQQMVEIREKMIPVWEDEQRDRISYINAELNLMGYCFPRGIQPCRLSRLSHGELMDLLHYIHDVANEETA